MLSVLQICLLSACGICAIGSIVFTILFFVEISAKKQSIVKKVTVEEVIEINKNLKEEDAQISVEEMLENLENQTKEEIQEEVVEVPVEEVVEEQIVEEKIEEVIEVPVEEVVEEQVVEEKIEEIVETPVEEKPEEETIEENKEESVEEINEELVEDVKEDSDDKDSEDDDEDSDDILSYEKMETEVILAPGTVIDYKTRLEKVESNKEKLEKDLSKIQKFILKYERTDRRKNRNQKMLDRRAGELTNLNLVMYSVTDIKNVDEDKKVKQEELTAHIAELKASIQDAEEYLESNREKYNHNLKMARFLSQERVRFIEEIAELKKLINSEDENN